MKEGWAFPLRAQRAHYFIGGASLCGRYPFLAHLRLNGGAFTEKHSCVQCIARLKARIEKQRAAAALIEGEQ
jgi:hypothetical protein